MSHRASLGLDMDKECMLQEDAVTTLVRTAAGSLMEGIPKLNHTSLPTT